MSCHNQSVAANWQFFPPQKTVTRNDCPRYSGSAHLTPFRINRSSTDDDDGLCALARSRNWPSKRVHATFGFKLRKNHLSVVQNRAQQIVHKKYRFVRSTIEGGCAPPLALIGRPRKCAESALPRGCCRLGELFFLWARRPPELD